MRMIRGAALLLILTACQGKQTSGSTETAQAVRGLMEFSFPDDGQIHTQSRGRFDVLPSTMACSHQPDGRTYRFSFAEYLRQLQQSGGGVNLSGDYLTSDEVCRSNNDIFINSLESPNRSGKLYKLVQAVWQGNFVAGAGAYWVSGIERKGDLPLQIPAGVDSMPTPTHFDRPKVNKNQIRIMYEKELISVNMINDRELLSRKFLQNFHGSMQ